MLRIAKSFGAMRQREKMLYAWYYRVMAFLVFVAVFASLYSPRTHALTPGGKHVISASQAYYTSERTSGKELRSRRTCTTSGWWWGKNTRCWTTYYYAGVTKYKSVVRYRRVYHCKSGYREYSGECKPDCGGSYGCRNGGTCTSPGRCSCRSGWEGSKCENDKNECSSYSDNRCSHNCKNTHGSYSCTCRTGYNLKSNGRSCKDINECAHSYTCGSNSDCTNTPGSYRCRCRTGFESSTGKYCGDKNECDTYHGCQHKCINTYGTYKCVCRAGHYLTSDGRSCSDHNECLVNNGGCSQKCENFAGGYKCNCNDGYKVSKLDSKSCTDINECTLGTAGCSHTCQNTVGSFICSCRTGYSLAWDRKTCNDIDECQQLNVSACSHICVNTIGSYYCRCRAGFDLSSNKKACQGRPCRPVYASLYGAKNCDGYVTESVCNFTCDVGHEMKSGSANRTCLPSKAWSGSDAVCQVIHCDLPQKPGNGFIYQPCHVKYKSQCELGCDEGFFPSGKPVMTCGPSKFWKPSNVTCDKSTTCKPNPCLRNGLCTPIDNNRYACNCEYTGYKGQRCETGEITAPNYPVMKVGETSSRLEFVASSPTTDVTLTIISANGVKIIPQSLTFIPEIGKVKIKRYSDIYVSRQGIFDIDYVIYGTNSKDYRRLESDVLVVFRKTNSGKKIDLKKVQGCHNVFLYKCANSDDNVTASSTSPWSNFDNNWFTSGLVNIHTKNTKRPLSISGASLPATEEKSDIENRDLINRTCDSFVQDDLPLQDFIETRAPENVYASSLYKQLPPWINITFTNNKTLNTVHNYQLHSSLLSGKQLKRHLNGYIQSIADSELYSVQIAAGGANLTVGNDSVLIPRYKKSSPITLVTELCGNNTNFTLIALPFESMDLVSKLDVLKRLKQYGWNILARSIHFLQGVKIPIQSYFNGTAFEGKGISKGNLGMQIDMTTYVIVSGSFNSTLKFNGTATAEVDDLNELLDYDLKGPVNVHLEGKTSVSLDLDVEGNSRHIELKCEKGSSFMQFQGKNETATGRAIKYKLMVNSCDSQDPFKRSHLEKYLKLKKENNISISMDAPLNTSDVNNGLQSATMAFPADLKDGPLLIPGLDVQLKITHENRSQEIKITGMGYQDSLKVSGDVFDASPNVSLEVDMTLSSNDEKPEIHFDADVNVFGTSHSVRCNASKSNIFWSGETNIYGHDSFRATYNATLNVELRTVVLEGSLTNGENSLANLIEKGSNNFARSRYNEAKTRVKKATERELRSNETLRDTIELHKKKEQEANYARREFSTARDDLERVEARLKSVETSAKVHSQEYIKWQEQMNDLCPIRTCEDICQMGPVCSTCYDYHEVEIRKECRATCYRSGKHRSLPYIRNTRCHRQHCVFIHHRYVSGRFTWRSPILVSRRNLWYSTGLTIYDPPICAFTKSRIDVGYSRSKRRSFIDLIISRTTSHIVSNALNCGYPPQIRNGWWKCFYRWVPCSRNVFNYLHYQLPYECTHPCTERVVKERISYTCCSPEKCAIKIPDTNCMVANEQCQRIREETLRTVSDVQEEVASLIRDYDRMRLERDRQMIEVRKLKIQKEITVNASNIVKSLIETSRRAVNNSRLAKKEIEKLSSKILQFGPFLMRQEVPFIMVTSTTFSTKERTGTPKRRLLPVKIKFYVTESHGRTLDTVLDFDNYNQSLQSVQKEVVKNVMGDVSHLRKKRSVGNDESSESSENIMSIQNFHKLCSAFNNSMSSLREVALSFNILAKALLENSTLNQTATTTIRPPLLSQNMQLNRTLAEELGVDITKIRNDTNSTESPLIDKIQELLNISWQSNAKNIKLESMLALSRLRTKMESIANQTHKDCSGLSDCLDYSVTVIFTLFDDIYTDKTHRVFGILKALGDNLENLTSKLNSSVSTVLKYSNMTLLLLDELSKEDIFCLQAPNITQHPPAMIELVGGERLLLSCNATGDELSYAWQLNSTNIKGQTSNNMYISSVTRADEGSYTCVVKNRVSREVSSPTLLIVHTAPLITTHPVPHLAPKIGTYAYLECKGEVKEYTNMTYQWIYQPGNLTNITLLPNKTFSVLSFSTVRSAHEGLYTCVVSNSYGKTESKPTVMEPLRYSLPVPSMSVTFTIESTEDDLHNLNQSYEKVAQQLVLTLNGNVQNVSVNNPQVLSCRMYDENNITFSLACDWDVLLKGMNLTGNRNIQNEMLAVRNESDRLQNVVEQLRDYIDGEQRAFWVKDKVYKLSRNTFATRGFVMECPDGQRFDQEYLSCTNCPSGSHGLANDDKLTACVSCDIGAYQPDQGRTGCVPCPDGFTTEDKGTRSKARCKDVNECDQSIGIIHGCVGSCVNSEGSYRCICPVGYHLASDGRNCTDVDECAENNGECEQNCSNFPGGHTCTCQTGYSVSNVDQKLCSDIDECQEGTSGCAHYCTNSIGSFSCSCRTGFELESNKKGCKDINECSIGTSGCVHFCTNNVGSFICSCRDGFTLALDKKSCNDIDECKEGTSGCAHYCTNTIGSFNCSCRTGFELESNKKACKDINECSIRTSGCAHFCENNVGSFTCSCRDGFTLALDKKLCNDIDECQEGTSGCAHYCTNTIGSFNCSCRTGFELESNKKACKDINECSIGTSGCVHFCTNNVGSFICSCRDGFTLALDEKSCNDIDECKEGTSGCAHYCTNINGSFNCSCRTGFELESNKKACKDINECSIRTSGCAHFCENNVGSFTCSCRDGFTLALDKKLCNDINECSIGTSGCAHFCTNNVGSFICSCRDGFTLALDKKSCNDINECETSSHGCSDSCVNTAGSYACTCPKGHFLASDGRQCTDVDECQPSNGGCQQICSNYPGGHTCLCRNGYEVNDTNTSLCTDIDECQEGTSGCAHYCTNTIGSFNCSCRTGFELESNKKACKDINECSIGTSGCVHFCKNNVGSFICSCRDGFTLALDKKSCNDINECETSSHGCSGSCVNTAGSYACTCPKGHFLASDGRQCTDVDECQPSNGGCQQICSNYPGGHICLCRNGYEVNDTNTSLCTDIDECNKGTSECSQLCINSIGSFNCSCNIGFKLATDNRTCFDVDECTLGTSGCQHSCKNSIGSFNCSCNLGYTLAKDKKNCIDIDECTLGTSGCQHSCKNSIGSFNCSCNLGYILAKDKKSCIEPIPSPTRISNEIPSAGARNSSQVQSGDDTNMVAISTSVGVIVLVIIVLVVVGVKCFKRRSLKDASETHGDAYSNPIYNEEDGKPDEDHGNAFFNMLTPNQDSPEEISKRNKTKKDILSLSSSSLKKNSDC